MFRPDIEIFRNESTKNNHFFIVCIIILGLVGVETFKLETSPHFEWDEGWTALVARNWVEEGHYGLWLNAKPAPPALNAAFPTTGLVALSFKLFGVGIWQGRLVGVLFMVGNFILIFYLARRLFNKKVAILTMVILCLSPLPYKFHPLGVGRQILAEPQMLFFLLGGYLCLMPALTRSLFFLPLIIASWSIALITKEQLLPFFIIALLVPIGTNIFKRRWRPAVFFGIALFGSFLGSYVLRWFIELLLQHQTLPVVPVKDLYQVVAMVFQSHIRLEALGYCLWYGWPTLLGLGYGGWKWYRQLNYSHDRLELHFVRLSLLLFAGGWMAWYIVLSIGYIRYLLPPVFIGSLFVADLVKDLLEHKQFGFWQNRVGTYLKSISLKIKLLLILVFLVGTTLAFSYISVFDRLHHFLFGAGDIPLFQAANFLNNRTPPKALVESYDAQLFFLLDRPYHCPPPQVHVETSKRVFLRIPIAVDYDPLLTDPDYLVVGPYSRLWRLYEPLLATNQFRLLHTFGTYDIYERQR